VAASKQQGYLVQQGRESGERALFPVQI